MQAPTPLIVPGVDARFLVIDNFYEDPDRVRDLALSVEYRDSAGRANFPGLESATDYASPAHAERFQNLIGGDLTYHPRTWVFGRFRISRAADHALTDVHLDHTDWAAIVYLTPDEQRQGGLALYSHRETGLASPPTGKQSLSRYGCATVKEFDRRYVTPVSKDASAWKRLTVIEARYNRLVMFEGSKVFHGISDLFGHNPESGRLTHNFFMNETGTR
ncbi:DUF6445 family protein [Streptomyces chattanoogensis]